MMRRVQGPVRPMVTARLERHIERGAARARAGLVEREDFRMRLPGPRVPAVPDDDAVRR